MGLHHTWTLAERTATMLLLDYTSAFNTSRPGKLTGRLTDLVVKTSTCDWILEFLTDRPQVTREGQASSELILCTRRLQACCLSPKLFTLHTSHCASTPDHTIIIKFADDTTILGLNIGGDEAEHRAVVHNTLVYGEENDLVLNIDKTMLNLGCLNCNCGYKWQINSNPLICY